VFDYPRHYDIHQLGQDLARILDSFVAAQLERGFRTLEFYKSLQPPEELSK